MYFLFVSVSIKSKTLLCSQIFCSPNKCEKIMLKSDQPRNVFRAFDEKKILPKNLFSSLLSYLCTVFAYFSHNLSFSDNLLTFLYEKCLVCICKSWFGFLIFWAPHQMFSQTYPISLIWFKKRNCFDWLDNSWNFGIR